MKPLQLKLSAFGPYIDEEIDFTKVNNKELFLVSGDTGSGKTMIFDAISVALYGESSGAERREDSFKSDYTNNEILMKIEYTFELKGKTYHIIRVPKQKRLKKRGEGFTEEKGYVEVYEIVNGERVALDLNKDPNGTIRELIGLDVKQFRQIVMIPQGQFRKLITESSEEREKILKSIFDVYKYQLFQRKLESMNGELVTELKEIKMNLDSEITHIDYGEDQGFGEIVEAEFKDVNKILEGLDNTIIKDKEFILEIDANIKATKSKVKKVETEIEMAINNNQLIKTYNDAVTEGESLKKKSEHYKQLEEKIKLINNCFRLMPLENNVETRQEEIKTSEKLLKEKNIELNRVKSELKEKIEALNEWDSEEKRQKFKSYEEKKISYNNLLPKVKQYEELLKESNKASKEFEHKKVELESLTAKLTKKKEDIEKLNSEINQYKGTNAEIEIIKSKLKEDKRKQGELSEIYNSSKRYRKVLTDYSEIKNIYSEQKEKLESKKQIYEAMEIKWLEGQASILAESLVEGEACPVCGNTQHISLAKKEENIPSLEQLKAYKKEISQLEKSFDKNLKETIRLEKDIENKNDDIKKKVVTYNHVYKAILNNQVDMIVQNYSMMDDEISNDIATHNDQLKRLSLQKENYEKAELSLAKLKEEVRALEMTEGNLKKVHNEAYELSTGINSRLEAIDKDIPEGMRDGKQIVETIKTLEDRINRYNDYIIGLKKDIEDLTKSSASIDGAVREATRLLETNKIQYKKELDEFNEELLRYKFTSIEQYRLYKVSENKLNELIEDNRIYNEKVASNKLNIQKFAVQTKDKVLIDLDKLGETKQAYLLEKEQLTKRQLSIKYRVDNNVKQRGVIVGYSERYEKSQERQAVVGELSNVTSGGRGTSRITFERYILASFFQEIIESANEKLRKMTSGRYELVRKTMSGDMRKKTGLDIEVYDYYTSKARDANTLSGGEGFKAALALALGLADVAYGYSGGIRVDAMFIDEGFDSLSQESLDQAIDCLLDINEQGRTVGIISHVAELKERIDTRIIVKKGKGGSKVQFEGV